MKRFIANANQTRKRCDQGVKRKISRRQMSAIKREAVSVESPRTTRCRILNTVAKPVKPSIHSLFTTRHGIQRLEWAKMYVKTDYQTVLFKDECRAALDGPDNWFRGWLLKNRSKPSRCETTIRWCYALGWDNCMANELVGQMSLLAHFQMPLR